MKGSTTAATVPTAMLRPFPANLQQILAPQISESQSKKPLGALALVWAREVSPELQGNPGMSELRHYQMKIPIVKIEKLTRLGMLEIA